MRPRSCSKTSPSAKCGTSKSRTFCRADQSTIISEPMEVNLEVRFMDYVSEENSLSEYQISTSKTVYHCTTKACTRKGVQGLYSFVTHGTALRNLFATTGTYLLAFSLVSFTRVLKCKLGWMTNSYNSDDAKQILESLSLLEDKRVILELHGTFCWESVPYNFPLVVLHTISIISHLCRLGGSVWVSKEEQPILIHCEPNSF